MKRIFLIFIAVLTILSCSKDMMRLNEHHVDVVSLSKSETLKAEFAKILSKAVTSEENLRIFIKNQALKKFDLDYDILYHNIKDMIVPGDNKTFRNIILEYCDDSSQLETIEKNLTGTIDIMILPKEI